jgi:Uma2 family endonuclease
MGAMTATTEPAGLPPRPLTVADLAEMPDDGHRYELLDGVLIVSPAPGWAHQMVVVQLSGLLNALGPPDLDVLVAPFAVRPQGRLPLHEQVTELQPDVLVARHADFTDVDLPTAPLLAVEVLSPSTGLFDLNLKRAAYERMGVATFWLIDPKTVELWAYELDTDVSSGAGTSDSGSGEGGYRLVAHVAGEQVFEARRPFPVAVRPADLLRRQPPPAG